VNKRDFFDRFVSLLKNTKNKHDLDSIHDALIVWFGENYFLLDSEEVKERIVSDNHAEGVDAFLIDRINYNLVFIQAKTVNNFDNTEKNFSENAIKLTLEGVRLLLRGKYKGNITPELENLIDEYHELDKTGNYKTNIVFITFFKKPIDDKFIKSFNQDFPEIEVIFYKFDDLMDFYLNKYLIMTAEPPEIISFDVLTNLLSKDTPRKSRVFTCKGKDLARIYNENREKIFQQNVRYSLRMKSKSINKQILETACDDVKSKSFWYFNNGITIICNKINEATSRKVISLKKAQIINGAQTTYALFEAYKNGNLKESVDVLIKAIEVDDKDFIESVTLYTNSQNAIRLRDLCSNDEIQVRIQKVLMDSYQYFYERKRGEFISLYPTIDSKREFLGEDFKTKIVDNENSAQAILAMYLDKPAQAKSEKGRIFMKENAGFYDDIFDKKDDILAEKILMSWKLLKYVEVNKKEYRKKYRSITENSKDADKIYKYDFLLHSEYFILNIFKDFLKDMGFDIFTKKDDLLKIILKIENNDNEILERYKIISDTFAEYIDDIKKQPGYYHNKFFKNEKSIGLIRNYFNSKYNFVEII